MAKEVMIFSADEIKAPAALTPAAVAAYKFALDNAGINMDDDGAVADFVNSRNAKADGFRDLSEFRVWCEKMAASIKEVCKHTFNVGDSEQLPPNVSWSKQSFTYDWAEGSSPAGIAKGLIESGLATDYDFLDTVTVTNMAKAAGITVEKLMQLYPDHIVMKPKDRTLKIK